MRKFCYRYAVIERYRNFSVIFHFHTRTLKHVALMLPNFKLHFTKIRQYPALSLILNFLDFEHPSVLAKSILCLSAAGSTSPKRFRCWGSKSSLLLAWHLHCWQAQGDTFVRFWPAMVLHLLKVFHRRNTTKTKQKTDRQTLCILGRTNYINCAMDYAECIVARFKRRISKMFPLKNTFFKLLNYVACPVFLCFC